jgi:hypothetical protein
VLIGPDRPYDPKIVGQRIKVAVAARSRRWSIRVIAEAFGLNIRTVRTLRDNRHNRYDDIHARLREIEPDLATKIFLDPNTIERLDEAERCFRAFGGV